MEHAIRTGCFSSLVLSSCLRPGVLSARRRGSSLIKTFRRSLVSGPTTGFGRSDPLRVLFCGSTEFSCEALRCLRRVDGLVESIDVVVRPGKRTGRGLKKITHVPLKHLADEFGLPVHEIDTFTGWKPPSRINLIIAMSFGLFVPPRILGLAKYGGINVHPSFLPDLRGPAPLQHMLLRGDKNLGVSVQTLDAKKFDHGTVLAQTKRPGIRIPEGCTLQQLTEMATVEGVKLLEEALCNGLHVPPHVDVGWKPSNEEETKLLSHAPKVGTADREIDWERWTAGGVVRRMRALGEPVWFDSWTRDGGRVRVLVEDADAVEETGEDAEGEGEGEQYLACIAARGEEEEGKRVRWREGDGGVVVVDMERGGRLRVRTAKVSGYKSRPAAKSFGMLARGE